jgi:anaerobic dimethyl sulfoxide reductase subunit B (iron-sulfur subunit)
MTCAVACKSWLGIGPGPVKPLRMLEWETGTFTNIRMHFMFATCNHCANPTCVDKANGAMFKEPKYGAVLIDPQNNKSLRAAAAACPYGAIVFDSDAPDAAANKCNMCIDRLEQGKKPVCVMSCHMRALDFDDMTNLATKYGNVTTLEGFPDPTTTKPSIIFKAMDKKTPVVTYDPSKALTLLSDRGTLPKPFGVADDVLSPKAVVGRTAPVYKPKSNAELMQTSRTDEG